MVPVATWSKRLCGLGGVTVVVVCLVLELVVIVFAKLTLQAGRGTYYLLSVESLLGQQLVSQLQSRTLPLQSLSRTTAQHL